MSENSIVLFKDGDITLDVPVSLDKDTVWLNANQMAALFDKDEKTIRKHINNVFIDDELDKELVVAKFATTTQHGAMSNKVQTHMTQFYKIFRKQTGYLQYFLPQFSKFHSSEYSLHS
ncbi:MAG TPA: hypothetical protein PLG87_07965 [Treponemataceae bacterium]|jgi:hypothetical protein|nr:hypothetical protein [Treponemataceae bacterium]